MFSYFPKSRAPAPQYQPAKERRWRLGKKRLKEMIVVRSMTVTQTASLPRCLAGSKHQIQPDDQDAWCDGF